MARKNNIYTLGYFRKRLLDAGYEAKTLVNQFSENDTRKWLVSVLNKKTDYPVFCLCTWDGKEKSHIFKIFDGNEKFLTYNIKTDSMNVIVDHLKSII